MNPGTERILRTTNADDLVNLLIHLDTHPRALHSMLTWLNKHRVSIVDAYLTKPTFLPEKVYYAAHHDYATPNIPPPQSTPEH